MSAVRTVLGDIAPGRLGLCDAHDHLFMTSAALPGEELTDPHAAERELRRFAELGGGALVQWTPFGMGRRPDALVGLSRRTGVHLVAATGMHRIAHTPPGLPERLYDRMADLFVRELTEGLRTGDDPDGPLSPARAGMIKVAGDFHGISEHTRRTMNAAAEAHHRTGAPIGVHLEHGTAGPAVLELLGGELGVPPDRVILGHLNRSPDAGMYRALAGSGAWLGFDGPSVANHATDWRLFETLTALTADGHAGQLLLGADTTTSSARGNPGMGYLPLTLRPRMAAELGEAVADQVFRLNPARAFAADWPLPGSATDQA